MADGEENMLDSFVTIVALDDCILEREEKMNMKKGDKGFVPYRPSKIKFSGEALICYPPKKDS